VSTDLHGLSSEHIPQCYAVEFSRMPDVELLAACARTICRPRSNPDSFSLHAPLELLARYLLSSVAPPAQAPAARIRMLMIATQYAEGGEFQDVPIEERPASSADLQHAIENGNVVAADACCANLCRELDDISLRHVMAPLASERLAGAGHSPILLNLVGRVSATGAREKLGACSRHRSTAENFLAPSTGFFQCAGRRSRYRPPHRRGRAHDEAG